MVVFRPAAESWQDVQHTGIARPVELQRIHAADADAAWDDAAG